ncbi:osteoclast stimulatory transmembrane protein [Brachionichthys hirsutus]|uniref:osteoclast stimulatory transmembrane protein n=1 Tax=Brachionichthys hirsutus TaxID=412623 RepID=UPI003604AE45
MKFITENGGIRIRNRTGSCRRALKSVLLHLWDVYSAPAPSGKDVLTLLSLCVTVAIVTGGLLHHWLSKTLKYDREPSVRTACVYLVAVGPLCFLCHPLRCVLTMILPTVCTKQGRRLLISASVTILVLNVVPNVTLNIGAVARILKCTGESLAGALLNSSEPLNEAKRDLVEETIRVKREDLSVVTNLRKLDHFTYVDLSDIRSKFSGLIGQMDGDFSRARNLLAEYKLLSNRVVAGIYVALLVFEASRYLRSYLTSVRFDNVLVSNASRGETSRSAGKWTKKDRSRRRISKQEVTSCVLALVPVTLYFFMMLLIVALDHAVYHAVQAILLWLQDFPQTSGGISVDYKVRWFPPALCIIPRSCITRELTHFHRDYTWAFNLEPSACNATTSAPDRRVAALLGCLWLVSYSLVFLDVYAGRLRRMISASFFREQEERRKAHLAEKIRRKMRQTEQIATISAADGPPVNRLVPPPVHVFK